ncbi:MAG: TetR/AcrR family transcriptional regulator [Kordiimonas sp.]
MKSTVKKGDNPKKNYHHGDLRGALVAAASDILAEDGMEKLSLRGVARRAGVSQAAPYHHFENKHALLSAVAAAGFVALRASMKKHAAESEDQFQGVGVGYVMFAMENPALFRLMQGPYFSCDEPSPELLAAGEASRGVLLDNIAAAYPDASERELRVKAAASWSIVHGLATLLLDGRLQPMFEGEDDVQAIAKAVTDLLAV